MKIPIQAIPTYKGTEKTHSDMADNKDIRLAIFGAMPQAVSQTKQLAKYFGRNSKRESCKAIFDFLKNDIKYVADGELQLIKLPSALLHSKVGDCKSFSIFTSAILTNLGIKNHFVLVSYNADPTPSHIYVQTDDGCIIDAVWGIFDDEKKPTYRYEVNTNGKMRVKSISGVSKCNTYMSGCGCGCNSCSMTGIGATRPNSKAEVNSFCENKYKGKSGRIKTCKAYWNAINWAEKTAEQAGTTAKVVAFSAGRNLLLVIIKANLDGFASKLAKIDFSKVSKFWKIAGGDPQNIQNAIKIGSQKPAKKLGLLGMLAKKAKKKSVNGISGGVFDEGVVQAAIPAVSTAAGAAVNPAAGTAAGASLGAVLLKLLPIVMEVLQQLVPSEEADAVIKQALGASDLANSDTSKNDGAKSDTGGAEDNTMTYLIIAAAAIGGIYFYTKKK